MTKKENEAKNIKKPWPTKDAMEQVYAMQLWGKNDSVFYSGDGSHYPEIVNPYIDVVAFFLTSFERPITVCDLGCGDFNIGKELVKYSAKYVAVDIVEDLIAYKGIRLKKQSGVNLLASPFNLKAKEVKQLLCFNLEKNKGVIVTTMYRLF